MCTNVNISKNSCMITLDAFSDFVCNNVGVRVAVVHPDVS